MLPWLILVTTSTLYIVVVGERGAEPSQNNHYAHLAHSWLHGQLHVVGNTPPGTDDWACYDMLDHGHCPRGKYRFEHARYRWYVSFPPLPALVMIPAVAVAGPQIPDRWIWALFAGLGPTALFLLLQTMGRRGLTSRSTRENLVLTGLFAFGTVYFFTAVQGTVWFAAHVVAVPLIALYLRDSLGAKHPLRAGLWLALAFLARPTTLLLGLFFAWELIVRHSQASPASSTQARIAAWVRRAPWKRISATAATFAAPIITMGCLVMWHNWMRFDDPLEFGHSYLQIRWLDRIERWGLFNYHYLSRNLTVFLASLPWLSSHAPHITVSRHGLALWFTTPNLLWCLAPKARSATMTGLTAATLTVLAVNLLYQNTGWVQFGYRFSLDYMVPLFALLALGERKILSAPFLCAALFATAVNTFGALTFDRHHRFYDNDTTQDRFFQPH